MTYFREIVPHKSGNSRFVSQSNARNWLKNFKAKGDSTSTNYSAFCQEISNYHVHKSRLGIALLLLQECDS